MKKIFIIISLMHLCYASDTITFFIAADPHVGRHQLQDNENINKQTIEDMNSLPGALYPASNETVAIPRGLLIAGDLTGDLHEHWDGFWLGKWHEGFDHLYQVNGEGMLRYPVYEGYGNHDFQFFSERVLAGIYIRNKYRSTPVKTSDNGLHYSWDWDNIHFINLNLYPGGFGRAEYSLDFLKYDLQHNLKTPNQPVILYHHYSYDSSLLWWSKEEREEAYEVMKSYNIIAIFTGHEHRSDHYQWHNIPIFAVPNTYEELQYCVCKITDNTIHVYKRKNGQWDGFWQTSFKR